MRCALNLLCRFWLLGLFLCAVPASGQAIEGKSDAFRLVIKTDDGKAEALMQVVNILAPKSEGVFETDEPTVSVKGRVIDPESLGHLLINELAVPVGEAGLFEARVPIALGASEIVIQAVRKNGDIVSTSISVARRDVTPPTIAILEPSSRGLRVVTKAGASYRIRGRALDEAGIAQVLIENAAVSVSEDGTFEADVKLAVGANAVEIVATDRSGLTTTETIELDRDGPVDIGGKYVALVIGIDQYAGEWPSLENAVHDARGVASVLSEDYKFDRVVTLYDSMATRTNIIAALEQLAEDVTPSDNLLIYYSGHGEFHERYDRGYWVPQDATTRSTAFYISNNDLRTYINGIQSQHTLLIADACFAGDVFRGGSNMAEFEQSEEYYAKVYRRISRKAITSGNVEPVMDGGRDGHSVFTYYLLKALKENKSRFFDAFQLFDSVRIPVINNSAQEPQFRPIRDTGDEGGQFVFVRK